MYLDFSAKVLSLQWSSKEIMFSNVYPHSTGDKLRLLSGPAEFIILDSGCSALKNSRKNQNQMEAHVGFDEMFSSAFFFISECSVSCFFIHLLLTKRDGTFSSLTETQFQAPRDRQFIRRSFHFSAFPELLQLATMKPF